MTPQAIAIAIARRLAVVLEDLRELERQRPDQVAVIVGHLVAHLRSWRPESVAPLGELPEPEGPIADPEDAARRRNRT